MGKAVLLLETPEDNPSLSLFWLVAAACVPGLLAPSRGGITLNTASMITSLLSPTLLLLS